MSKATDWNISNDIYDIVKSVDELKSSFIDDQEESTLALGIFGFLGATEAKKIQTAVVMTGELGNEMFPTRAKLDKNIVTHAIYCNIEDLNAIPSHITLNLAIKESDLDTYMENDEFIIDSTCPIYIGEYEFHFDYNIIISRYKRSEQSNWIYNARYDMSEVNNISDINNPYLTQPFLMNFNNQKYVFLQSIARQVTIETTEDKLISASVIDNKSFTFTFENQLVDFDVYIIEKGKTTRLKPYFYGQSLDIGETNYCWYLYINDNTVRISFDKKSYAPGLNATIRIVAKTTIGEEGNFSYQSSDDSAGFYIDMESEYYSYKKITCLVTCASDAIDGKNKKSTEELKSLIPKMAMSRGYITTETDLSNYFNMISDANNKLYLQKKVDNQLDRVWYCYLLSKDEYNNIIPSNTLPINIDTKNEVIINCNDEGKRYIIPCGTTFVYDPLMGKAEIIDESSIPEKYSKDYFKDKYYYRNIYNIIINEDPLYCAGYMSIINDDGYFEYNYVNPNIDMGFVVNNNHIERSLLSNKNTYKFTFSMVQSVNENYGLYSTIKSNETTVVNNKMKVFLLLMKDGTPYRYSEAKLINYDKSSYLSSWEVDLETDNSFDTQNQMKLLDLYEPGYESKNYGFFKERVEAYIYIYAEFDEEYGRYNADKIIKPIDKYSLVNIYKIHNGLRLFDNYTNIINNKIVKCGASSYNIYGVPLIGEHFFLSDDNIKYFMDQLNIKKLYIDYCLSILENNMNIDFKFYNTYGYSNTFTIGDKDNTSLGNIDITMNFRLKLINANDITIKDDIIDYIKNYIENINESADEELHIPNLLHDIKEKYNDFIVYIEFMNFNDNRLGINHIEQRDVIDPHTVKEFINVRNYIGDDGILKPNIAVELV